MKEFEFIDISQFALNNEGKITVYRYDEVTRVEKNGGFITARTQIARKAGKVASFGFLDEDVLAHAVSSNDADRLSNPYTSNSVVGSPFISVTPNERVLRGPLANWIATGNRLSHTGMYEASVEPDRLIIPKVISLPNGTKQPDVMELLVVGDIPTSNLKRIG